MFATCRLLQNIRHSHKMATIITHNGSFHADEALAVFLIRQLPSYKSAELIRTRNPDIINVESSESAPRIVLDVGGKYEPNSNRFDHHQREFTEKFNEKYSKVRLSSAGLVYKHFGKDIIAHIILSTYSNRISDFVSDKDPKEVTIKDLVDSAILEELYYKLYDSLILSFDAIDNGVNPYETDLEPIYRDSTGISSRVSRLNPGWNDPRASDPAFENGQFEKASLLCGAEFTDKLDYYVNGWLPAKSITKRSFDDRFKYNKEGKIMVLDHFCPWKDHLHEIEKETGTKDDEKVIYCLYEDDRSKQWRIQAVATRPSSFESRRALPESWRGVRDESLSSLIDIPGSVFVHATGFIGGNKTFEGALKMATKALE